MLGQNAFSVLPWQCCPLLVIGVHREVASASVNHWVPVCSFFLCMMVSWCMGNFISIFPFCLCMTCAHSCDVISKTIMHDVFRCVRGREEESEEAR